MSAVAATALATLEADAEILAPNFGLQRKVGGSAARLMTPERVTKSEAALEALVPPLQELVRELIERINAAVRGQGPGMRDAVWADAHELRGLAGTARRVRLGQSADFMCRYLNDTPPDFVPEPVLMGTFAVIAMQCCRDGADDDPVLETLLTNAAKAVAVQRRREGRGDD
jgi:hypothetical protein